ncbi:carboxypeptidase N subunit 2-like [Chironomus tepperi]|uniref:carboxypeptidase N subunit 2-like n=1 Tax=Chironomus tepperi TaxID=113505 RepID=UPI00391F8F5F
MNYKRNNIVTAVALRFPLLLLLIIQCTIKGNQCERIEVSLNDCQKLEVYYQCKVKNLSIIDKHIEVNFKTVEKSPNDIRIESSNMSFIPKQFFENFKDVKEFVAINCSIKNIYYDTFIGAFKLHYLVLSHNKIEIIPDYAFRNISDLQSLKLDNNEIEILTTNVFRGLDMLRTLKLSFNKIMHLPLYIFNELESLEILELDNNRIRIISQEQFVSNLMLTQLDLHNNEIRIIDNGTFNALTNLQHLNLDNNSCVSASTHSIKNITRILECCMTSQEEMKSCLKSRNELERKANGNDGYVNILLMTILTLSILGNILLFLYCFVNRRLMDRFRGREDVIELVNNMRESSYQGF